MNRLEVWVPLPSDTASQRIRNVKVDSPYPGSVRRETERGNSYFYFSTEAPRAGPLEVRVRFNAERAEVRRRAAGETGERPASREELEQELKPESLVSLSPRVRTLARQVVWGHRTPEEKARATLHS